MSLAFFSSGKYKFARLSRFLGIASVLITSTLVTGCLSVKQYVDPTLPKVAISDLQQPAVKQPVQLFFEFQTRGATNAQVTANARPVVIETLKKSNLFSDVVVAPSTADRKLFITINNVGELKDATDRGFTTGLTFGLSGSMVTDGYVLTAYDTVTGKEEVNHKYKHAIYSTIGNADGPKGLTPAPQGQATRIVLDDLLMNLLNDMSRNGELQ